MLGSLRKLKTTHIDQKKEVSAEDWNKLPFNGVEMILHIKCLAYQEDLLEFSKISRPLVIDHHLGEHLLKVTDHGNGRKSYGREFDGLKKVHSQRIYVFVRVV